MAKKKPVELEVFNEELNESEGIKPEDQDLIDESNSTDSMPEETKPKEEVLDFNVNELLKQREYTIILTKKFHGQKEGTVKVVSGNVAKALINKKVARLK